jgi:hypothetical protein
MRVLFSIVNSKRAQMPIRKLIDSGSFPPEELDVIYKAFDLAWAEVSAQAGTDETAIEFTRNRLARAIISEAKLNATDPIRLKDAALETFRQTWPLKD